MSRFQTRTWRLATAVAVGVAALGATGTVHAAANGPTWSQLSPPAAPPALAGASAAWDPASGTVVLFGGQTTGGTLSDATWVWNGSTWSKVTPFGAWPPARTLGSMGYDEALGQLVLFGGQGAGGPLDDTWVWNGASWEQLPTPATPGPREGAAMATEPDGRLVLFGGWGSSNAPAADTAAPSTTTTVGRRARSSPAATNPARAPLPARPATTTTTSLPASTITTVPGGPPGSSGAPTTVPAAAPAATATTTVPPATAAAVAAGTLLDDTWVLVGSGGSERWQPVRTPVHPPAAWGSAMAANGSTDVLFGGDAAGPGGPLAPLGRSWTWTGEVWRGEALRPAAAPRSEAVLVADPELGGLVLFGGQGAAGALGDTWTYRGGAWAQLAGAGPGARAAAAGVYDPAARQVVVFGGSSGVGVLSSTAVLTAEAPAQLRVVPASSPASSGPGRSAIVAGPAPTTTVSGERVGSATTAAGAAAQSLHGGDAITLTGSGFLPHARVTITFHSAPVLLAVTRADAAGTFRVTVTVPAHAATGRHHFAATGPGRTGLVTLMTPIEVAPLGEGGHIPATARWSLLALAVAIPVATWLALELVGRLRRPAGGA